MNKKVLYIFVILIVCVVGFFVYRQFFKTENIKNYPSKGTDIIAFGDSLIYGQGASASDKSFVSLLSKRIGKPIINLGIPGNTTADALDRIRAIDTYNPKIVLVLLGGNDYLQKVQIDTTFRNLSEIIQDIERRGAVVVLLGVRGGILRDTFSDQFEDLSEQYHTAYVSDVLSGLIGDTRYMSDAVHPNDIGYQKIADRIYPKLVKLLK